LGLRALPLLTPVFNHTIDEPDHLAPGMEWLSIGKYRYEDQYLPLAPGGRGDWPLPRGGAPA